MPETNPSTLTQYGIMAEKHWREFRPQMVKQLEATGKLQEMLLEAQEKTAADLEATWRQLNQQGILPAQAFQQAWEMVREKYILLPPEDASN